MSSLTMSPSLKAVVSSAEGVACEASSFTEILQGNAGSAPFSLVLFSTNEATSKRGTPTFTRSTASSSTSARILPARRYFSNTSAFPSSASSAFPVSLSSATIFTTFYALHILFSPSRPQLSSFALAHMPHGRTFAPRPVAFAVTKTTPRSCNHASFLSHRKNNRGIARTLN